MRILWPRSLEESGSKPLINHPITGAALQHTDHTEPSEGTRNAAEEILHTHTCIVFLKCANICFQKFHISIQLSYTYIPLLQNLNILANT